MPVVSGTHQGNIILYSSSNITVHGTTFTTETHPNGASGNIGIFPDLGIQQLSSLSGNNTITITPQAVSNNLVPGGFVSIVLPSNNLAINTGGDTRMLAPIVAIEGTIQLNQLSGTTGTNASGSAVALVARLDITTAVTGNTPGVGTAGASGGSGGLALLFSTTGNVTIASSVDTAGDTGTAGTIGGAVTMAAPQALVTVGGALNGISIDSEASSTGGNVLIVSGSGITLNNQINTAFDVAKAPGDVTLMSPRGSIVFQNATNSTDIEARATNAPGGFITFILGQGQGAGIQLAGGVDVGSNNSSGGTFLASLQQGNLTSTTPIFLNVSSSSSTPGTSGGNVVITVAGQGNQDLNWQINASGPNGGSITIQSGGTLQLPNAAGLDVHATDISGPTIGTNGSITLVSDSTQPFQILGTTGISPSGTNFVQGQLNIDNSQGNNVTATANGGSITIINRGGAVSIPNFNNAVDVGLKGNNLNGASISIQGTDIQVNSVFSPGSAPNLDVSGTGNGKGGSISLITQDPISPLVFGSNSGTNFLNGNLLAQGGNSSGDGGSILINTAGGINVNSTVSLPITISASGSRNGGTINIATNSANDLNLGNPAGGFANNTINTVLNAAGGTTGGNGNGGSISLTNFGGQVVVNQTADLSLNALGANGQGGNLNLFGSGVLVNGSLSVNGTGTQQFVNGNLVNGANGGTITIDSFFSPLVANQTQSGQSFISGTLSANGGTSGSGGTINLIAAKTLNTSNTTSIAAIGNGTGNGGTINLTGSDIGIGNGAISATGAGSGNGGTVNLTSSSLTAGISSAATISTVPGTTGTTGGSIQVNSASGLFNNSGTLVTNTNNATTGSTTATGGTIGIHAGNGTNITAQLNVTNTGTLEALGKSGTGQILLDGLNGSGNTINVNDSTHKVGSLQSTGGVTWTTTTANVNVFTNSIAGSAAGPGNNIDITTATGDLSEPAMTAAGSLTLAALTGNLNLTGDAIANGGAVALTSDPTKTVTITNATGTAAFINTGNLSVSGSVTATTGDINFNQLIGGNFTVTGTGGTFVANSGNGNVNFNGNVGTTTGSISAANLTSISGTVNATGTAINIGTSSNNLIANAVTATNGALTLAANGGNLTINGNAQANGGVAADIVTLNSASGKQVSVNNATGSSVNVNTSTLVLSGTITASLTDINFNPANGGSFTMSGGTLNANRNVNFDGNVGTTTGTISATGLTSITGTVNASGTSINISTSTNDLITNGITATNGPLSLAANGGNLSVSGNAQANGGSAADTLTLTSTAGGQITVSGGSGSSVFINTGTLILSGTLSSTAGDINVNKAVPAAFTMNGGTLSANNGSGKVDFEGGSKDINVSPTQIVGTVIGGGNSVQVSTTTGSLTAGAITTTGSIGSNSVGIALTATGGNLNVNGAVQSQAGVLNLTSSTTGAVVFNSGGGTTGQGTGTVVNVSTPTLTLSTGQISSTAGNINIQNPGNGTLTVTIQHRTGGSAGLLTTVAGNNIVFDNSTAGSMSVTGTGDISSAGTVNFNGGTTGSTTVSVNVGSITGANAAPGSGAVTGGAGASFSIQTNNRDMLASSITTGTGSITLNAAGGNLLIADAATLNSGQDALLTGNSGISAGAVNGTGLLIQAARTASFTSNTATADIIFKDKVSVTTTTGDITFNSGRTTTMGTSDTLTSGAQISATTGGAFNMTSGDVATAHTNVLVTASTGIDIEGGSGASQVQITAGSLDASVSRGGSTVLNPNVANGPNPISSAGRVQLTSNGSATGTGLNNDVIIANAVVTSSGADITVQSGSDITNINPQTTASNPIDLAAVGGNIIFNAIGNISLPAGGALRAVAIFLPGTNTININNNTVGDYRGGTIFLYAGGAGPNSPDLSANGMHNLELTRLAAGLPVTSGLGIVIGNGGSVDTSGVTGGSIVKFISNGGSISINGPMSVTSNGGILVVQDPAAISLSGLDAFLFAPPIVTNPTNPGNPGNPGEPGSPGNPNPGNPGGPRTVIPPIPIEIELPPSSQTTTLGLSERVPTDTTKNSEQSVINFANNFQLPPCQPTTIPDATGNNPLTAVQAWIVANGSCEGFVFEGEHGNAIVGAGGTAFAPIAERTILLRDGKLVALSGSTGMFIDTSAGRLSIPKDSTIVVEQKPSGLVRIANLSGGTAEVAITHGGLTRNLTATPGQEVAIADNTLAEEELIPVDGVSRTTIEAGIIIQGLQVKKDEFDRKAMVDNEVLLQCNLGCFTLKIRKKIDDLKAEVGNLTGKKIGIRNGRMPATVTGSIGGGQSSRAGSRNTAPLSSEPLSSKPSTGNAYQPISFTQPAAASSAREVYTTSADGATFKHAGQLNLVVEKPGFFNLKDGETLVASHKQTIVRAGEHIFRFGAGTIAMLSRTGDVIKCRSLWEGHADSIAVYSGGKWVTISAGQELIVAPSDVLITATMKDDSVGRRHLRDFDLDKAHHLAKCDFSIVSLMQTNSIIKQMLADGEDNNQPLARKIMKMAVCLNLVTATHGSYSRLK
jgi:hypothetical protein